jgi:hypothetical protein
MKKINLVTFLISTILIGILTFMSFISAFGADEGNKLDTIWKMFTKLFYVLRFPTHILFWGFLTHSNLIFYFIGLFINSLFYAFII